MYEPWRPKSFFNLESSFQYLCNGSTATINILILSVQDRLYTLEVYRRQILTYKDWRQIPTYKECPRTEKVECDVEHKCYTGLTKVGSGDESVKLCECHVKSDMPAITRCWTNVGLMVGQWWAIIRTALGQTVVLLGSLCDKYKLDW